MALKNRDIFNEVYKSGFSEQSALLVSRTFNISLPTAQNFEKCLKRKWLKAGRSRKTFEKKFALWLDSDTIYEIPSASGGNHEI